MKLSRAAEELTLIYGLHFRDILALSELKVLTKDIEYVKGLQLNLINVVLFFLRSYLLLNPSVEP